MLLYTMLMDLFQPNRGPAPWPEVHRLSMDCSQIVAAYNARQSGSRVELSCISVSLEFECFLEKMAMTR